MRFGLDMTLDELKNLFLTHFKDAQIFVDGDGRHFETIIISHDFAAKSSLQRQREVYALVTEQLNDGSLHALTMKLYTPEEWNKNEKQ